MPCSTYKALRLLLLTLSVGLFVASVVLTTAHATVTWSLVLLGVTSLLAWRALHVHRLETRCTARTVGRIVDVKRVKTRRSHYYAPVVEFDLDDQCHRFRGNSECEKADVFKAIDVYYDPDDPTLACTVRPSTRKAVIFCAIPLAAGVIALIWQLVS